ncbi:hypothetical protein AVEN_127317-1 [Araneus ventricosus]|uniref:Uncharacterized protein n=1 Tax=Araneus ventricosus TaxID=182803 RepID=A0A4Y2SE59_ARAVE|nr:hypothetical protein AVEN_248765-1 [Araneus ventricosus]GBN86357.1 hypothetical protein AVEN_127317-1 [Araneus ventricosus]
MTVHVKCRECHTRPSSIMKAISHQDDKVSENRTSRRAEDSAFDFQNHCLFCVEEASDDLRYIRYNKEVTKTLSSKFNLETLTIAATSQHSLHVYIQVQQWLGNNLDPTEWGRFLKDGRLNPVPSTLPAASEELLQLISYNCKITLARNCSAKKADLYCT